MARPAKPPHPLEKQIEGMAAINCSWQEISDVTGIPVRTAKRKFGTIYKKGVGTGKSSLKRKMWETAMGGNVTMMIWLSKQMLGYTDKVEQRNELEVNSHVIFEATAGPYVISSKEDSETLQPPYQANGVSPISS